MIGLQAAGFPKPTLLGRPPPPIVNPAIGIERPSAEHSLRGITLKRISLTQGYGTTSALTLLVKSAKS